MQILAIHIIFFGISTISFGKLILHIEEKFHKKISCQSKESNAVSSGKQAHLYYKTTLNIRREI